MSTATIQVKNNQIVTAYDDVKDLIQTAHRQFRTAGPTILLPVVGATAFLAGHVPLALLAALAFPAMTRLAHRVLKNGDKALDQVGATLGNTPAFRRAGEATTLLRDSIAPQLRRMRSASVFCGNMGRMAGVAGAYGLDNLVSGGSASVPEVIGGVALAASAGAFYVAHRQHRAIRNTLSRYKRNAAPAP